MKNPVRFTVIIILSAAFLAGCCKPPAKKTTAIDEAIERIQKKYAPDHRVELFDIRAEVQGKSLVVKGNIENREAKTELLSVLQSTASKVVDSVFVCPDPKLGEKQYGIICISVGNMRVKPDHGAEMGTQVLMGSVVRLLKQNHGWYLAQSSDRYLGWIDDDAIVPCTKQVADAWPTDRKIIITSLLERVLDQPKRGAGIVCDVVAGCVLKKNGSVGSFADGEFYYGVELPDKRTGYLPMWAGTDYGAWKAKTRPTPAGIERMARSLLGVPYLWGGTSTKGVDCSGFTKTVYMMNGFQLKRDASQQVTDGLDVDPGEKFRNLRKGDLLFFGRRATDKKSERITHVAIYIGDRTFIHSSGMVRFNSLDPASPIFAENRLKTFVRARRIIASSVE